MMRLANAKPGSTWIAAGIVALALAASAPLAGQQAEGIDELETVLVTGEHPGPGLWKVSKGDHVMWVLGTHAPLPKGMTWRSKAVEARIAESQEVLLPGAVDMQLDFDIGLFKALSLLPAAAKADKLPDGRTLKDVLPAATYAKWSALRDKYLAGRRTVERSRPSFAIDELRTRAYRKEKLTDGPVVVNIVRSAAKRNKVKVRRLPDVVKRVKLENIEALLKHMRSVETPDTECFITSLDRVESDIEQLKALANAWARGEVQALRDLHTRPEVGSECDDVIERALLAGDTPLARSTQRFAEAYERSEAQGRIQLEISWIRAARAAIDSNRITFAVLPIREVVGADGYVAKLKELGYEVEGQ